MWALHVEFWVCRAREFCAAAQFVLCTATRPFNSLSGGELDVPLSLPAKASMELSQLMKLGLMLSDTAVSQRNALKELSQSMRLGLMLSDTPLVLELMFK